MNRTIKFRGVSVKNGAEVYEGDEVISRFGSRCLASFRHYGDILDGGIRLHETRIIGGAA